MSALFTPEEIAQVGRCGEVFAGEYAQEELRSIERPRILDIGANIGAFAVWASRYWPGCWLRMYEPNIHIAERRAQILTAFGVKWDVNEVAAIVEHTERATLLYDMGIGIDAFTTTLHSASTGVVPGGGVPMVSADSLPSADIVKLDCEGAECFVLAHYQHWATCRAVLLEWHTVPNRVFAEYVLPREGFTCLRGLGEEGLHEGFSISYGVQIWMRK